MRKNKRIKFPLVCPECKSTDVCEISSNVLSKQHFRYAGPDCRYEEDYNDSEVFGDSLLQCGGCGYRYSEKIYQAWLAWV